jgi:hypothetical protein
MPKKGESYNASPVSRHRGTIGSPGVAIDRIGSLGALEARMRHAFPPVSMRLKSGAGESSNKKGKKNKKKVAE